MDHPSPLLPLCANWSSRSPDCGEKGVKACGNCKLVVYCGVDCQKAHWQKHKLDCRSPLAKQNWRPTWEREARDLAWATGAASRNWHNPFGANKYLWGNTPALNILNLEKNEGLEYRDDIALLFAASGDIRHIVKTVASLPDSISQQVSITVNDRDFDVVARNTILLLLALTTTRSTADANSFTPSDCVDVLTHFWYSAFIPARALYWLNNTVKPLIDEVCSRVEDNSSDSILEKSWEFNNGCSLRLVLAKKYWIQLQSIVDASEMSRESAAQIRCATTLAPERLDYRERWHYKEASPFIRLARKQFQEDGLLLPFGHPRAAFNTPNPTFFRSKTWPMDDKADPSAGWLVTDVEATQWPAKWDWYGKLYKHVSDELKRFLDAFQKHNIRFDVHNLDVKELPQHLQAGRYCRIEAANVCDGAYLGIRNTLSLLSPLLQSRSRNPCAAYIAIFINAVKEAVKMGGPEAEMPDYDTLMKYFPTMNMLSLMSNNNADAYRIWDARDLVLDVNKFFERYMVLCKFEHICKDLQVEMKQRNTIVDMWPTQLKLREGQDGAIEEFRSKLGSGVTNVECCIEWRRAD